VIAVPAVEIDHISKRYGRTLALDDVTFDVKRGDVFALLGPNGAGKTTLLHILCTILRPDGGTARIGGVDVMKNPLGARRSLGVVFQEPSLDDRLTVAENLEFHGLVYGVPKVLRRARIGEMLALVARQLGARAFLRHEAAPGDRPRAGARFAHSVSRRADRRPRCSIARAHVAVSAQRARRARADRDRHHALYRGGRELRSRLHHRWRAHPGQ
jgi:ABC-type taurine transport system ATPase subunit